MLATPKHLIGIVFVLLAACSRGPERFIDNLAAGMSEADAINALGIPAASFRVEHESNLAKDDPRPPYSEKTITTGGARCAGQPSDIALSFFLGELSEITCYPRDVDALINALVAIGVLESAAKEFTIERDGVEIRAGDAAGRWGITFSSKRRVSAQQAWIEKYS